MNRATEWLRQRSLWQVLGVYLAGSWVAFEVITTLTEAFELPPWLPRVAAVLIGAGVPILLAATLLRRRQGLFTLRNALVLGAAAFGILFGIAGLTLVFRPGEANTFPGSPATAADRDRWPAIAVLPFVDMSPQGDQAYFSDGITEEILAVLSRVQGLRMVSRSSAFAYKGRDLDLRQVGSELGVPYLLGGSVRKDGERVRISAELVSASDGIRLWSDTYDRQLESIFAIQTDIAEAIARELRVPLKLSDTELVTPTPDMEAHDSYLSARAALRRRGTGVAEAIRSFEASIARDSGWAPAWAGLAEAHAIQPLYVGRAESTDSAFWHRSLAAAETAALRALELDPRNASARVALGGVHRDRWEWAEGERQFLQALELDPDSEEAHTQYAELLWGMGRLDESLEATGRALALDRSPVRLDIHGFVLYMNGRYAEAEAMLEEGLAIDTAGDVHFLRTVLANLLLFDGRYREALERFSAYLTDSTAFRRMGEALEARDTALVPDANIRGVAQIWTSLGAPNRALTVLEEMVFAMPFRVQYEVWDPILAPLWNTPRFQEVILPRLNLRDAVPSFASRGGTES